MTNLLFYACTGTEWSKISLDSYTSIGEIPFDVWFMSKKVSKGQTLTNKTDKRICKVAENVSLKCRIEKLEKTQKFSSFVTLF